MASHPVVHALDATCTLEDWLARCLACVAVVKFTATWCGPCQAMAPVFHEAVADLHHRIPAIAFLEVDADLCCDVMQAADIAVLPTLRVYASDPAQGWRCAYEVTGGQTEKVWGLFAEAEGIYHGLVGPQPPTPDVAPDDRLGSPLALPPLSSEPIPPASAYDPPTTTGYIPSGFDHIDAVLRGMLEPTGAGAVETSMCPPPHEHHGGDDHGTPDWRWT